MFASLKIIHFIIFFFVITIVMQIYVSSGYILYNSFQYQSNNVTSVNLGKLIIVLPWSGFELNLHKMMMDQYLKTNCP